GEAVVALRRVLRLLRDAPVTADRHPELAGPERIRGRRRVRGQVGGDPAADGLRVVVLGPVIEELVAGDDTRIGRRHLAGGEGGGLAAVIEAPGVVPALVEGAGVAARARTAGHPAHRGVVAARVLL